MKRKIICLLILNMLIITGLSSVTALEKGLQIANNSDDEVITFQETLSPPWSLFGAEVKQEAIFDVDYEDLYIAEAAINGGISDKIEIDENIANYTTSFGYPNSRDHDYYDELDDFTYYKSSYFYHETEYVVPEDGWYKFNFENEFSIFFEFFRNPIWYTEPEDNKIYKDLVEITSLKIESVNKIQCVNSQEADKEFSQGNHIFGIGDVSEIYNRNYRCKPGERLGEFTFNFENMLSNANSNYIKLNKGDVMNITSNTSIINNYHFLCNKFPHDKDLILSNVDMYLKLTGGQLNKINIDYISNRAPNEASLIIKDIVNDYFIDTINNHEKYYIHVGAKDPDEEPLYVKIDYGDGTVTDWLGPFEPHHDWGRIHATFEHEFNFAENLKCIYPTVYIRDDPNGDGDVTNSREKTGRRFFTTDGRPCIPKFWCTKDNPVEDKEIKFEMYLKDPVHNVYTMIVDWGDGTTDHYENLYEHMFNPTGDEGFNGNVYSEKHTYEEPGTYTITVTAKSNGLEGCSKTITVEIQEETARIFKIDLFERFTEKLPIFAMLLERLFK